MPVTIKSTGGGSVTVQAPATASDYTVNFPATNGDMVVAVSGAVTPAQGGTGQTSLTANNVLLGNGTSAVQFVAPGTSGNVLTSNGTTWTSTAPTSTGINVQTFTSSGTWTKPSGYAAGSRVLIQAWGGGGGGGRGTGNGGGGGGGGYNERWLTLSAMGATETVTVGAGGAARTTDGAGNNGGNTSVGSLITAYAGGGATGCGGGGGGQLSAGANGADALAGYAGKPWFLVSTDGATTNYYVGSGSTGNAYDGWIHGGGGGGNNGTYTAGNSVWGGGGGAGRATGIAGTSSFGGAGGASGISGTAPGGGGGGVVGATSGAGGNGQVIITVFPA
jgi:hypothetical protein